MSKNTDALVKGITTTKKVKAPINVRVERWTKGTLAPFVCKAIILGLATWALYDLSSYVPQLSDFVKGAVALAIIVGLIAGASKRK